MQSDDILKRLDDETRIVIDGKTQPELVPYAIRMKLFFYRYKRFGKGYQAELKPLLTQADESILSQYADTHADAVTQDEARRELKYAEVLAGADGMSGLDLANAFERTYQMSQEEAAARYRSTLVKLSPQGRKTVEDFAYARVRPVMSLENQVAIARAAPDLYKARVIEGNRASHEASPADASQREAIQTTEGASVIKFSEE